MKSNLITAIKLAASPILSSVAFFGILSLFCYFNLPFIGMIVGWLTFCLMLGGFYPWWFKDYIKQYWEKENVKKTCKKNNAE